MHSVKWPFVIVRPHLSSLVFIRSHSLSLVLTRCTIRCHSLSLEISLVCLFITDQACDHSMINELNKRFLKFTFKGENKFIDQSMISHFANHDSRQQINNKPGLTECNIWVLAEAYGYLVQFKPYQGVKKGKVVASSTKWELGKNVVLRLMKCLPPTFINNCFTSFLLLTHLGVNNIWAIGVFNKNRLHECTSVGDKQPQKKRNVTTLKRAHQAKTVVQFDSSWFERHQSGVRCFF